MAAGSYEKSLKLSVDTLELYLSISRFSNGVRCSTYHTTSKSIRDIIVVLGFMSWRLPTT